METLGQFGPISVLPNQQVTGTFNLNRIKSLNRNSKHCVSDEKYSYTECLNNYVRREADCNIDVFSNEYNCNYEGLRNLYNTLTEIKTLTKSNITETTGCLPKCRTHRYQWSLSDKEDATWRKDWISSFYLSSETTTYQQSVENYSYDEQVHISGSVLSPFLHYRILLGPSEATSACSWAGQ